MRGANSQWNIVDNLNWRNSVKEDHITIYFVSFWQARSCYFNFDFLPFNFLFWVRFDQDLIYRSCLSSWHQCESKFSKYKHYIHTFRTIKSLLERSVKWLRNIFKKTIAKLGPMNPWKSFIFVTSGMQCKMKRKKKFELEIQSQGSLHVFPSNFPFIFFLSRVIASKIYKRRRSTDFPPFTSTKSSSSRDCRVQTSRYQYPRAGC